jgi:hypothetical protein
MEAMATPITTGGRAMVTATFDELALNDGCQKVMTG